MTVVVDASVVVASLVHPGRLGRWAEDVVGAGDLSAPHLLLVEATNALRRAELGGRLSADLAAVARDELAALPVELFPFQPLARRVWELRATVTSYDAWYVALAESLEAPLATLDGPLTRSPGPRCAFLVPDGGDT